MNSVKVLIVASTAGPAFTRMIRLRGFFKELMNASACTNTVSMLNELKTATYRFVAGHLFSQAFLFSPSYAIIDLTHVK